MLSLLNEFSQRHYGALFASDSRISAQRKRQNIWENLTDVFPDNLLIYNNINKKTAK